MALDTLALIYAVAGGVFMGSFAVPMKTSAVLKVKAHPLIFQSYKSFWVFVGGWVFVLRHYCMGAALVFEFNWWAVISAMVWIPAGLCVIASIPRLGVALAMTVMAGTTSVLSFLTFWLVLGEKMKVYGPPGHPYYLAPIYLFCVVVGMVGVVMASQIPLKNGVHMTEPLSPPLSPAMGAPFLKRAPKKFKVPRRSVCLLYAVLAGTCVSIQYGVVTVGKSIADRAAGCDGTPDACPSELKERFNNFGSWSLSFGLGAVFSTLIPLFAMGGRDKMHGHPSPSLHLGALGGPGSLSGICFAVGNFLQTAAVSRGGQAVVMPVTMAVRLVTSSMWGLLYYRELRDTRQVSVWVVSALWTIVFMKLLADEHVAPDSHLGFHEG